jgi:hypothetical protein
MSCHSAVGMNIENLYMAEARLERAHFRLDSLHKKTLGQKATDIAP